MPTAARLVSAVLLAILAYVVSGQVMVEMPPSTDFGVFVPFNIVLGLLVGWFWLGPNSGQGLSHAISVGLTSAAVLTALALFCQAWNEMMRLAMLNRYSGFFEAVSAIFVEGLKFAEVFNWQIVATLAIGGIVAGICADWAARRFS